MNLEGLDPERVYQAIENGVHRAICDIVQNATVNKHTPAGDRVTQAMRDGVSKAVSTGLNPGGFAPALSSQIVTAIREGTEAALKPKN